MLQYETGDNIIVSSHPKSGTVLTDALINLISGCIKCRDYLKENKNIINENAVSKVIPDDFEITGVGVNRQNRNIVRFCKYDSDGRIGTYDNDELSEKILYEMSRNALLITEHISPAAIFANEYLKQQKKKIFVMRDFRDVYNSLAKYVDQGCQQYAKMEILGSYEDYRRYNYACIHAFHECIKSWKEFVAGYLEHKDEMYLLRYEDIIKDPEASVVAIGKYLGKDITMEEAMRITGVLLNRDLSDKKGNRHMRHFSGSSVRSGEWRKFFSRYMVDTVKRELGDLLIECGYEKHFDWDSDEPIGDGEKIFRAHLDKAAELYEKQEGFIKDAALNYAAYLDRFASDKKIAIFGAGFYSSGLLKLMKNKDNISFIVDSSPEKRGVTIEGKEVCPLTDLVRRHMDYDIIMVALHDRHRQEAYMQIVSQGVNAYKIVYAYDNLLDQFLLSGKA